MHLAHVWMFLETLGEHLCIVALLCHAQFERFQATMQQKTGVRVENSAEVIEAVRNR